MCQRSEAARTACGPHGCAGRTRDVTRYGAGGTCIAGAQLFYNFPAAEDPGPWSRHVTSVPAACSMCTSIKKRGILTFCEIYTGCVECRLTSHVESVQSSVSVNRTATDV